MTTTVQITHPHGAHGHHIVLSDTAKEHVRHNFNPSGLANVNHVKALAAAFITELERLEREHPHAAREFAHSKTTMQTASMWAVLGVTKEAK